MSASLACWRWRVNRSIPDSDPTETRRPRPMGRVAYAADLRVAIFAATRAEAEPAALTRPSGNAVLGCVLAVGKAAACNHALSMLSVQLVGGVGLQSVGVFRTGDAVVPNVALLVTDHAARRIVNGPTNPPLRAVVAAGVAVRIKDGVVNLRVRGIQSAGPAD